MSSARTTWMSSPKPFRFSSSAIEVAKQAGWTEKYDEYGNLTLFADDGSGGLLFRTIETGANETLPDNAAVAELILSAAESKPYSRRVATDFAGGSAEAFHSTMSVDGPVVEIVVVIRKLDERHLAIGITMIPLSTKAEGRATVMAQFALARIANR